MKMMAETIVTAKKAAIEVLLHNLRGPYRGLPRTAGWGYPEPYTRDLLIASLGMLLSREQKLVSAVRKVLTVTAGKSHKHVHDGLRLAQKPYFALWSFKNYSSERFDLLGNSLAVLTGLASPGRAAKIIAWVETECRILPASGDLALTLPPNFFPYIRPEDPDWLPRYDRYNRPGMYHNGGIWPFICGFYIAAAVAAWKPN